MKTQNATTSRRAASDLVGIKKPFKTVDEMRETLLRLEHQGFLLRRTEPDEAWMLHPRWADSSNEEILQAYEAIAGNVARD